MTLRSYQNQSGGGSRSARGSSSLKPSRWQRFKRGFTRKRVILVILAILLVGVGWFGGKFLYNAHKLFGNNLLGVFSTTKLKGEDTGRVNILLAGNSADDPGHGGAELTDSIMLVSIDTKNNKAFMLSVPRDLWVHIPRDGHEKINQVYVTGKENDFDQSGYPKGGMGQLEQVVSQSLGVPINYYALVDYQALKQSVDAVGGVDLTIKSKDPRGLYDPNIDWETKGPLVKLTNGSHHLNGRQALDLARARGDAYNSYGFAGSDFDRTENQRQLLVALKNKAATAGTLANPAKLSSLADAIGNNVQTNLKPSEIHRLYDISKKISGNNIQSLSLNNDKGKSLLASYQTRSGQSALIPAAGLDNFSAIQSFVRRQTSSNKVIQEDANVVVLNGTTTDGLAVKIKRRLAAKHITVSAVGDSLNTAQTTTAIIDNGTGKAGKTAKPATKAALVELFGAQAQVTTQNPYAYKYPDADFIIVVGADQVKPSPSTSQ